MSDDHCRKHARFRCRDCTLVCLFTMALAACSPADRKDPPLEKAAEPAAGARLVAHVTEVAPVDYTPPPDTEIPNDSLGASIRRGRALLDHTTDSLPGYAPGNMQCSSCHINAGRTRDAAGLMGVAARFPKYMDRTGAVISLQDRVNYCFTRSLAGAKIPTDSREMTDIIAYLTFISLGMPAGSHVIGEAMPKMPQLTGDTARGRAIYTSICFVCHGPEGKGTPPTFPAVWGEGSFSVGASMAREERAASFIRHFMPQNNRGSLTDQQAYDVAAYINAKPRPDSPAKTRDWPIGGAPYDVPYNTFQHQAYRPPVRLLPRADSARAVVPPPSPLPKGAR